MIDLEKPSRSRNGDHRAKAPNDDWNVREATVPDGVGSRIVVDAARRPALRVEIQRIFSVRVALVLDAGFA